MEEKYGFVYIWFDRKHKRYYVGSHWGNVNDGYICSSNWMKKSYKRRPQDFKRRILKSNISSRKETFEHERYVFTMIKPEELKIKYYNLILFVGHWSQNQERLKTLGEKIKEKNKGIKNRLGQKNSPEHNERISRGNIGQKRSKETCERIGNSKRGIKQDPEVVARRASAIRKTNERKRQQKN